MSSKYEHARAVLLARGKSVGTTTAAVSTVSSLESRINPEATDLSTWEHATDANVDAMVLDDKVVRYRLKLVLTVLFGDSCAKRWPSLFRANRRPSPLELSEEAALPLRVHRMSPHAPIRVLFGRLYREFVRASASRTPSPLTLRSSLAFVFHFLFGDPAHSLVPLGDVRYDEDALVAFLVNCTPEDVRIAYSAYRARSEHISRQATLATLCGHIRTLNFLFKDVLRSRGWGGRGGLTAASFGLPAAGRKRPLPCADADGSSTTGTTISRFSLRFVEASSKDVPDWVKPPEVRDDDRQHTFTADEVRRIYLACETLFEKLLCTALLTTGMRRKGFARGETKAIIVRSDPDRKTWTVGPKWWTTEKRNQRVAYDISPALSKLLVEWARGGHAGAKFVVPSLKDNSRPISGSHIFRTFRGVTARAGVVGHYVHPHTTRHTVAWTLSALGNSIEDIARFVHHKNSHVTNSVYVNMSRDQCLSRMTCPWLGNDINGGKKTLEDTAWELAEALASPFTSPDGKTFPVLRPPSTKRARRERNSQINREMGEMMAQLKALT